MRILIIEDDKALCSILEYQFKKNGMELDCCYNGENAFYYACKQVYDIIVLDRMLPGKDGISILKELRKQNIATPVIMLTAMGSLKNRIEGLDTGADDYLTKPFEVDELLARIRALARRPVKISNTTELSFSDFCLNESTVELIRENESCTLSKREYDLLSFLIKNKGQILTREILLSRVWGSNSFVTDGNLDNFICFLRKRLRSVHSHATIKTIRSIGYRLEE
jgi:DNA-binding response OmpR family regulator